MKRLLYTVLKEYKAGGKRTLGVILCFDICMVIPFNYEWDVEQAFRELYTEGKTTSPIWDDFVEAV
jgi:hypothetical protein